MENEEPLTPEEMEDHLLWARFNPDLHPYGIRCIDIKEYTSAIHKRKPIRELKAIFELREFAENRVKLAVEEADKTGGKEIVSRDPFGRFFRATFDETGNFIDRVEIKGTDVVVVVFKPMDDDQLWGALFLDNELSIIPWKRAVTAVPLLKLHNWIPYDDTYPEHLKKVDRYVLDVEEKRVLLNEIPWDALRQFLEDRDMFIFTNSKSELIERMAMMSFSYDDMKMLFTLAGRKTD